MAITTEYIFNLLILTIIKGFRKSLPLYFIIIQQLHLTLGCIMQLVFSYLQISQFPWNLGGVLFVGLSSYNVKWLFHCVTQPTKLSWSYTDQICISMHVRMEISAVSTKGFLKLKNQLLCSSPSNWQRLWSKPLKGEIFVFCFLKTNWFCNWMLTTLYIFFPIRLIKFIIFYCEMNRKKYFYDRDVNVL